MSIASSAHPTIATGNIPLVDRTRRGVRVEIGQGVTREAALNRWFSRHVPRGPWRDADQAERDALHAPAGPAALTKVYVIDLPESLLATFWAGPARALLAAETDAARKEALDDYRARLLDALTDVPGLTVRSTRTFDLMIGGPGLASTAYDARSGEFVGLHLDDHENLGLEDRSRGFRLLALNLGRAERFFQFVNHDAASLLDWVGGASQLPEEARSAASLVQSFFSAHPDCPVVRLTLQPSQAYIAVTQDLIHDGATNDQGRPDVNCLLGGAIELTEETR